MSWCKMPVVSIHPVSSYRRLKRILCYFWAIFDPPYLENGRMEFHSKVLSMAIS